MKNLWSVFKRWLAAATLGLSLVFARRRKEADVEAGPVAPAKPPEWTRRAWAEAMAQKVCVDWDVVAPECLPVDRLPEALRGLDLSLTENEQAKAGAPREHVSGLGVWDEAVRLDAEAANETDPKRD